MNISSADLFTPWTQPPEQGAAIEVADGVLWMRLPLPMALDHVNVYALRDADGWTLVDTGFDTKKSRAIWESLLSGPLGGAPVRRVLVTHFHPDHIGLAGWFQSTYGAELITTRTSWLYARMLILDEQHLPAPEVVAHWQGGGMPEEMLRERRDSRPFNFSDVIAPLPIGFTRIRDGQEISLGGRHWTVRVGNGHAPEHATLWSADDNLVITGDQILPSISPNLGVYPTEPADDPVKDWMQSCAALATHTRPDQLALCGHKLPFTGIGLRLQQLIENHEGALARLTEHLSTPRTAAECFTPLFKRAIGKAEFGLALDEAIAHLNHLLYSGAVTRQRRDDGAWLWQRK